METILECLMICYMSTMEIRINKDLWFLALINSDNRQWDLSLLPALLNATDVVMVLAIPLSIRQMEDAWVWRNDSKVRFFNKECI